MLKEKTDFKTSSLLPEAKSGLPFYADRTSRRHCDHRDPGSDAFARAEPGEGTEPVFRLRQ